MLGCGDALFSWFAAGATAAGAASPTWADVCYLTGYPLVGAGLVGLVRARGRFLEPPGLIDSGIVTVGLGVVVGVVLAGPIVHAPGQVLLGAVVDLAYPAADIVLLALLARLLTGAGTRTAAVQLLVLAVVALLLGDLLLAVVQSTTDYASGALDLFWLVSYVLWGAAALHPSMPSLTQPGGLPPAFSRRRLGVLTICVVIPPAAIVVLQVPGGRAETIALAVACIVLFTLVVARMAVAIRAIAASTAERDRLADHLAHQAAHDALTQLPNRAHTVELLDAALAQSAQTGQLVAVLFVDLDHFKAVNDTYGHHVGDAALREAAARLVSVVRCGDVVGRLGGDEFVILLQPAPSQADVVAVAERLVAALGRPMQVEGRQVVTGASIGVAFNHHPAGTDPGSDADALLRAGDIAAYRAKACGRGRVEVFDDALRRQLADHADLEDAIGAGLANGEFVLHYQPVINLTTGQTIGYEALARWQRPGHGLLPPSAFIPAAEQSNLICDLDRWVLDTATAALADWTRHDLTAADHTIAVNISGRHLTDDTILRDVRAALAASGLDPRRLTLEITESVLVDTPTATTRLAALRALGVRVAIDGFGTGYTCLGQLAYLHADTLKIDRRLVASDTPGSAELLRLLIHAAHAHELIVIAEGVEQPAQLTVLTSAGCDQAQGFLLAPPHPPTGLPPITQPPPAWPASRGNHVPTTRNAPTHSPADDPTLRAFAAAAQESPTCGSSPTATAGPSTPTSA